MTPVSLRSRSAFSLIELLLAVFILAIGIISVTAIFPAGIAQQQAAADDQLGPLVAESAIGIIRNRVSQGDFGTFEAHGVTNVLQVSTQGARQSYVWRPTLGDWSWCRPSYYRVSVPDPPGRFPDGAIDVFGSNALAEVVGQTGAYTHEFRVPVNVAGEPALRGIPFSVPRAANPTRPPTFVITKRERCWPVIPEGPAGDLETPDYMWDCMFRRSGGKVQVAIFVYRVVGQGGTRKLWLANEQLPIRRVLGVSTGSTNPSAASGPAIAPGWAASPPLTFPGPYTSGTLGTAQGLTSADFVSGQLPAAIHQWQAWGQWIVDDLGNIHRVTRGRRLGGVTEAAEVRLSSPIPVPDLCESSGDYDLESAGQPLVPGVRTFHFVPVLVDGGTAELVPVYATVRDL
jgi:type II secretory pathway pseudopilin PulG